jgi:hypothetical protein
VYTRPVSIILDILVGIDETIEPDPHQTDPMSNGGAKLQSPSVITRQIEFLMPPGASRGITT